MAQDVISLITADHREVERIFDQLRSRDADRAALVAELGSLLIAHSRAEEERVYPVIAKDAPDERDQVRHSEDEHHQAEDLVHRLEQTPPDDAAFDRLLDELVEAVTHHVETEESEVLPALREAVSDRRLAELGTEFSRRRQQALEELGGVDVSELRGDKLYEEARKEGVEGRSTMRREELADAVREERRKAS